MRRLLSFLRRNTVQCESRISGDEWPLQCIRNHGHRGSHEAWVRW